MDELSKLFGGTEQLWQYIKIYAAKAGREATRVVLELYYVVKSPHTPALDKTLIIAALGYQLLPDDRKMLSREKYGLLGLLDNGAALALAYSRVKARVTPQIEAQVDTILDQWFGVNRLQSPDDNGYLDYNSWEPQPATIPVAPQPTINTIRPNNALDGFSDDEDVVID